MNVFSARALLGMLLLGAADAQAALPDYLAFPGAGEHTVMWVSPEWGRRPVELDAARKLAAQGVTVWAVDLAEAYFLPPLPRSLDQVPIQDMTDWLLAALEGRSRVTVYAVSRAAVPMLRAAAALTPAHRIRLCMILMSPNFYASTDSSADAVYLDMGRLDGLSVRLLQPRRSAATPWLSAQLGHLASHGARVSHVMLENVREAYWARETPTEFEIAEGQRLDALLMREIRTWGCQ